MSTTPKSGSQTSARPAPPASVDNRPGCLEVFVRDAATGADVRNAEILLFKSPANCYAFNADEWLSVQHEIYCEGLTDEKGYKRFDNLPPDPYVVLYNHVGCAPPQCVVVHPACPARVCFDPQFGAKMTVMSQDGTCTLVECPMPTVPGYVAVKAEFDNQAVDELTSNVRVYPPAGWEKMPNEAFTYMKMVDAPGPIEFAPTIAIRALQKGVAGSVPSTDPNAPFAMAAPRLTFRGAARPPIPITGNVTTALTRTESELSTDLPLWALIRHSSEAMSFTNYAAFLDSLFCGTGAAPDSLASARFDRIRPRRALPFTDSDSYRVLKVATEAFVMVNCAVLENGLRNLPEDEVNYFDRRDLPVVKQGGIQTALNKYLEDVGGNPPIKTLPYLAVIRRKLPDIPINFGSNDHSADLCFGLLQDKLRCPCLIELIWSYWLEEGMLVQTMNVITQRFQNLRSSSTGADPLANTEIDALRPLNNLLWGYTQDEQHRLSVMRRNYEYNHHYGVSLEGKAVQNFRPADSRSKFLAAFHHLLRLCTSFFRQDDDTTVKADAFPVLNALKEVHLILTEGAHNQYGDLPSTARIEMLMQQWILGRPEFREFLPTRLMVAYPEPWMDRLDAMKKLQGWTDTSIMHFRALAIFGEQLLLSMRYGHWSDIYESGSAFNWARYWRPQIQGYIHSYRAVTGVDLSIDSSDTRSEAILPSVLLRQRLTQQIRAH
jgi:hypothetical protein